MEDPERTVLTMLCGELKSLRDECAHQPGARRELLERIETEAAARRPFLPLLAQLMGVDQQETRRMIVGGLPGVGGGHADEESFGCPDGSCDRVCVPLPAGPIPRCTLLDVPMQPK